MRSTRWIFVAVAVLAAAGCQSSSSSDPGTGAPQTQGGDILRLDRAVPERVTGSFERESVRLVFDLVKTAKMTGMVVKTASGEDLINISIGEETGTVVAGAWRATVKVEAMKKYLEEKKGKRPGQVSPPADAYVIEGSDKDLEALAARPEYRALPFLSRALGEQGKTGRDFPATYALHMFARKVATQLEIKVPPLEKKFAEVGYCVDMRTLGNGCFGMCGDDCNCWEWVCGDCCCHDGCYAHDEACDDCGWNVLACLECWTPLAVFVWAFGGGCGTGCDPGNYGGWGTSYSCNGFCGGFAGGCWCDQLCTSYGDCCSDYWSYCAGGGGGGGYCAGAYSDCSSTWSCCDGSYTCQYDGYAYSWSGYSCLPAYAPTCSSAYTDCSSTWTCCDWGYQCMYDSYWYSWSGYSCQYVGY